MCPESGTRHTQVGIICPESGACHTQVGILCPESGACHTQVGILCPEPGACHTQVGILCPEPGACHTQVGILCPGFRADLCTGGRDMPQIPGISMHGRQRHEPDLGEGYARGAETCLRFQAYLCTECRDIVLSHNL